MERKARHKLFGRIYPARCLNKNSRFERGVETSFTSNNASYRVLFAAFV
jgi:hypothetical protein